MSVADSPRVRASADTLATRVGEEIVLVHTGTDQIYVLNRTGARVWELLCEDCDRGEIARRLAREFAVMPAEVSSQVEELIADLATRRLVAFDPADGSPPIPGHE